MTPSTPRQFTSDATKFLHHPAQLVSYRQGKGHTVVSTHISMTAACNLRCSYCAYANRDRGQKIDLAVLKDYIEKLESRGLRAVTLTGGGEPTLHPDFNEFADWLCSRRLAVGLITNGTTQDRISAWEAFTWIRVSVNMFEGWRDRIAAKRDRMRDDATLGCSMIYTGQSIEELQAVSDLADNIGASYVRLVPSWLLSCEERAQQYVDLERKISLIPDARLTILRNFQRAPRCRACHLSYFRPYLSEIAGGTVYQCCVSILTGEDRKLPEAQRICAAGDVLDFLDRKIPTRIVPELDCERCTFADAVEALDAWTCDYSSAHDLFV